MNTPAICCQCHMLYDADSNPIRKATAQEEERGSHGYCHQHFDEAMAEVQRWKAEHKSAARAA